MSKLEKEIERLRSKPKDYTYDEARSLLNKLGFFEYNKGRTSGSKVEFKICLEEFSFLFYILTKNK